MLESLITSRMRVQILMRLFFNPESHAYLRELANEFDASPGHVRAELQQLSKAGLLSSEKKGRQIEYRADRSHPLFPELQSIVRKAFGMDRILESIIGRLGRLEAAYLMGDYAEGRDTGIIDLVLVGDIDQRNLVDLITKTERHLERRIRTLVVDGDEFRVSLDQFRSRRLLLLWQAQDTPKTKTKGKLK